MNLAIPFFGVPLDYDIVLLLNIVAGASSLIGFFSAIIKLCGMKPRMGCTLLTTTQASNAGNYHLTSHSIE